MLQIWLLTLNLSLSIPKQFNDHFLTVGWQNDVTVGNEFMKYLDTSPIYSLYLSPVTQIKKINYLKTLKHLSWL